MTKRDVIIEAIRFRPPPYVPWDWGPTHDCAEKLKAKLGVNDLTAFLDNHFLGVAGSIPSWNWLDKDHIRDPFGVVWDKTVDKDIGTPCDWPIKRPEDLKTYTWPDTANESYYRHIPAALEARTDLFRIYSLGFSLYERAWTMRGMDALLMDMVDRPEFVEEFLNAIVENNLHQVRHAIRLGCDCVYFGDDYGMQIGLIMGLPHWRHFIKPRLARMFAPVREAGKFLYMHSCGRVDSLFDDLVEIGLNVFNPFQPEVMDVFALVPRYHGRLAFHGGMSVQKVLPFGTVQEVRDATERLLAAGAKGGYIFSPSHAVPRDVSPENLIAMMEVVKSQPGLRTTVRPVRLG
jgi:uroporphyrinogen decarboxylase